MERLGRHGLRGPVALLIDHSDLERLHLESAAIIAKARQEADAIITRSRADAESLREELRAKARTEAEGIVRSAERQIQAETARAVQKIAGISDEARAETL